MSEAESPVVPFDARIRFPGNYEATVSAVGHLRDLLSDAYDGESLDDFRKVLHQIPFNAKLDADEAVAFETWWTTVLSLFPEASLSAVEADDYPGDLHPLVRSALLDAEALQRHRDIWFLATGAPRLRARSASQGSTASAARARPTAAEVIAATEGGGAAATKPQPRGRKKGAASAPRRSSGAGSRASSHASQSEDDFGDLTGGENEDDTDEAEVSEPEGESVGALVSAKPPLVHPLPARPPPPSHSRKGASAHNVGRSSGLSGGAKGGSRPSQHGQERFPGGVVPRLTLDLHQPGLPAPVSQAYGSAIRARLAARTPSRLATALPPWVQALRSALVRRKLDYGDKTKRPYLVEGWTFISMELGVDLAHVQQVALGEFLPLALLRDYEPPESHAIDGDLLDVLRLQHLEKKRKRTPTELDPFSWRRYFDMWAEVYSLVNLDVSHEQERAEDIAHYREFIQLELDRAAPQQRERVLLYDEAVRREVALAVGDGRLRYFSEASRSDVLYTRIVVLGERLDDRNQPPSQPSRSKPRSDPSTSASSLGLAPASYGNVPNDVCGRYNDRVPHGDQCGRLHVCAICRSDDGHVAKDCGKKQRGNGGSGGGSSGGPARGANAQKTSGVRGGGVASGGARRG
ncbi:hypothetical protein JCM10213_003702 [Rhodosporidiobolus nylandii]